MTLCLAPRIEAPQHERAPRPLPLFLDLVRQVALKDPRAAAEALRGLRAFAAAPEPIARKAKPIVHSHQGAALRDCGGSGVTVVIVPSPINPPDILDFDDERSLAGGLVASGARVLLLDWGRAQARRDLDLGGHVADLLEPLLAQLATPAVLLGYCLGGTLALAAASRVPVLRVATLATPWHFAGYPVEARHGFAALLRAATPVAEPLGLLPMEVLQTAFWSLDPVGVITKYDHFAKLDQSNQAARDFVALEQWANTGEPLPWPAAKELASAMFGDNEPEQGRWRIGRQLVPACSPVPTLHLVAARDRITPAAAAPPGEQWQLPTGHVGLVIGAAARERFHPALFKWLGAA